MLREEDKIPETSTGGIKYGIVSKHCSRQKLNQVNDIPNDEVIFSALIQLGSNRFMFS